jgi:phage-related minor tail protein
MHLGRFTVEIPHVVNTTNRTSTGTYEFTAANGDRLTAGFTGQATLTAPGVLSIVETATITGGTGRFADATGSFIVERLFNQVTGLTSGSFEGTISSPGAGTP